MKQINSFKSIKKLSEEAKLKKKMIFAEEISFWILPHNLLSLAENEAAGYLYTTLKMKDPMDRIHELEVKISEMNSEIDEIKDFIR